MGEDLDRPELEDRLDTLLLTDAEMLCHWASSFEDLLFGGVAEESPFLAPDFSGR